MSTAGPSTARRTEWMPPGGLGSPGAVQSSGFAENSCVKTRCMSSALTRAVVCTWVIGWGQALAWPLWHSRPRTVLFKTVKWVQVHQSLVRQESGTRAAKDNVRAKEQKTKLKASHSNAHTISRAHLPTSMRAQAPLHCLGQAGASPDSSDSTAAAAGAAKQPMLSAALPAPCPASASSSWQTAAAAGRPRWLRPLRRPSCPSSAAPPS